MARADLRREHHGHRSPGATTPMIQLPATELRRRAGRLRIVLTDVDGVLTDAGVYYSERGEELKRFSVRDGMGVDRLREAGVDTAMVTREVSPCVARRAEKLRVRAHMGLRDKAERLDHILEEHGLAREEAAYIGDDVNDLGIMEAIGTVGLVGAPAGAAPQTAPLIHYQCSTLGGHGAFREFAEWILLLRASNQGAS